MFMHHEGYKGNEVKAKSEPQNIEQGIFNVKIKDEVPHF